MITFFHNYLYEPLLNFLIYLYHNFSLGDFGVAVILLTLIIRVVLLPIFYKSSRDQAIMQKIAPKLKEIQRIHKEDKEKQIQATLELYREHKVNPFSSFILLFIQFPILIVLFYIFSSGFQAIPGINTSFLGLIDLAKPNFILVVVTAIAQYYQSKLMIPKTDKQFKNLSTQEKMSRQMVFIGPIVTLIIFMRLPSALALYWLTTSVFSVIQQIIINKKININQEVKKEEIKLEHGKK